MFEGTASRLTIFDHLLTAQQCMHIQVKLIFMLRGMQQASQACQADRTSLTHGKLAQQPGKSMAAWCTAGWSESVQALCPPLPSSCEIAFRRHQTPNVEGCNCKWQRKVEMHGRSKRQRGANAATRRGRTCMLAWRPHLARYYQCISAPSLHGWMNGSSSIRPLSSGMHGPDGNCTAAGP